MKNMVNIINFIRGIEPREDRNIDLVEPVKEQIRLLRENQLRGTFLLQYDALIRDTYISLIKDCADICEIGVWLEIVQPLTESIGEIWRGRYPWDWYNDVGFLIGYEPQVRLRLIDEIMSKFYSIFGYYPKSVGAWHIDAVSLAYLEKKYQIKACCICRDQVGVDGYTLQGGYYNQAYYPSKNNIFSPAQEKENQISVPVFRMLGSDPVYEYDYQVNQYDAVSGKTPTLEPIGLGGEARWCDWFFKEVFDGGGLVFQYTQAGQENSFGWFKMKDGLTYQHTLIRELADSEKVEVMTLGESGEWYQNHFDVTPAATYSAMDDFTGLGYKSVWYCSRYYRANVMYDKGTVRFRDIYLFDEEYEDKYLRNRCRTHSCEFRNLPVMDGVLYTNPKSDEPAGIYFTDGKDKIIWDQFEYHEDDHIAKILLKSGENSAAIIFDETGIVIDSDMENLQLHAIYDAEHLFGKHTSDNGTFTNHNSAGTVLTYVTEMKQEDSTVAFLFDGWKYNVVVRQGILKGDTVSLCDGRIQIDLTNLYACNQDRIAYFIEKI